MKRRLQRIELAGPAGRLDALLVRPDGVPRAAALVCHPHPQHGGSMHTKAVYHTARALETTGCTVLRFNFRGVGRSAGRYDEGRGELEDARSALAFLGERFPQLPLLLGGFSFGSSIALRLGMQSPNVRALLGIGPPLELYDFDFLVDSPRPLLLVAGSADPFCPTSRLLALQRKLGERASVTILSGAGHLLTERLQELQDAVRSFVARVLPDAPAP